MAKVHILNVTVHNNPAPFFTPFQFEIHFECLEELQDDLEFKIIYVGSAETIEFDQTLDQIVVDAVPKGQFKFMFQADPPDTAKIPGEDAVGVTVVLITASYRDQEFVRVGYYVNNEYECPEMKDNPPIEPQFDKLIRTIATDQPRVTKFKINWDSAETAAANVAAHSEAAANAGTTSGASSSTTATAATTATTTTTTTTATAATITPAPTTTQTTQAFPATSSVTPASDNQSNQEMETMETASSSSSSTIPKSQQLLGAY